MMKMLGTKGKPRKNISLKFQALSKSTNDKKIINIGVKKDSINNWTMEYKWVVLPSENFWKYPTSEDNSMKGKYISIKEFMFLINR